MDRTRVLFICTGNSARSQMAEAFLRHLGGDRFDAHSAGLKPSGIHPLTVRVMEEIGLDISGQRSKGIEEYMGRMHFGYLITVCARAEENCPAVFPGVGQRLHWDIPEPSPHATSEVERIESFRRARDEVARMVAKFVRDTEVEQGS
jgi:arsenate reductase (thioredoxin)